MKPTAAPVVVLAFMLFSGSACGAESSALPDGDVVEGVPVDGGDPGGGRPSTPTGGRGEGPATGGRTNSGTTGGEGRSTMSGGADQGMDGGDGDAGEPPSPPPDAPAGTGGDVAGGEDRVLHETIVVEAGETYDGQGMRFVAGPALGDGSQSEDQQPLFRLEDGARLVDVVLGSPAADGIHCYGDAMLQNIIWEDIGEDALTIKESGTVILDGGSARDGDDKVFQVNAASTFVVSHFTATDAGKFIRQNGGTTFKVDVVVDRCDISRMDEAIFRTDSPTSTVTMTNTRYSMIGDALFLGVSPDNITERGNTEY